MSGIDRLVESIRFQPSLDGEVCLKNENLAGHPRELLPIECFLAEIDWWSLSDLIVPQILDRTGADSNGAGFNYDDQENPGSNEVTIHWDDLTATLSVSAFEKLMLRFMRTVIDAEEQRRSALTQKPWWPELIAGVEKLAARVRS